MLHTTPLTLHLDGRPLLVLPPLEVAPGEVLTLMGPSGCGKSSLLAALAGVLPAGGPLRLSGDIYLGERLLSPLPPQARQVGMLTRPTSCRASSPVARRRVSAAAPSPATRPARGWPPGRVPPG